ncbi:hypothetical protein A2U01_0081260, partial [Trifolium medium]|nr:hypothetical protein [Trifolium medium]
MKSLRYIPLELMRGN